jgi:hypothetical protein
MNTGCLCKYISPTIGLFAILYPVKFRPTYSQNIMKILLRQFLFVEKKSLITATVLSSGAFPARSPFHLRHVSP